ncbi:MAG: hypothetical protein ACYYKD_02520 [Rhodospirillales bacterium]
MGLAYGSPRHTGDIDLTTTRAADSGWGCGLGGVWGFVCGVSLARLWWGGVGGWVVFWCFGFVVVVWGGGFCFGWWVWFVGVGWVGGCVGGLFCVLVWWAQPRPARGRGRDQRLDKQFFAGDVGFAHIARHRRAGVGGAGFGGAGFGVFAGDVFRSRQRVRQICVIHRPRRGVDAESPAARPRHGDF